MTRADLDEIKRLVAAYRTAKPPHTRHTRARLETALVEHVDALIAAAESAPAKFGYVPDEEQAPYVAEPPQQSQPRRT